MPPVPENSSKPRRDAERMFVRNVVNTERQDDGWTRVKLICGHVAYVLDYWEAKQKYCPFCLQDAIKSEQQLPSRKTTEE